ncbi:BLUF domain-containing protein [Polaribacter aestuariivivens]|uniref:BLUF domain-containing protein n=1 Tax=Polaribacter aestuariivivens TaxID=2304626 RepID=UPI003F49A733
MYQLNYHSISKSELNYNELNHILENAIENNSSKNITGCLVYHNNRFVQILEGNKSDVVQIFEKIKLDQRHHSVTLLWENDIDRRFFPEWNMAYHQPKNSNLIQFINNLLLLSEFSDKTTGSLLSFWATVKNILSNKQ